MSPFTSVFSQLPQLFSRVEFQWAVKLQNAERRKSYRTPFRALPRESTRAWFQFWAVRGGAGRIARRRPGSRRRVGRIPGVGLGVGARAVDARTTARKTHAN